MGKIIKLPRHKPPILHENATLISFSNCHKLGSVYKEIIGLENIHHFSLNVVDEAGKMSILSFNPQIAYNIFKDGSYLYNGSISPSYYNNFSLYTWDEAYDPRYATFLKNNMERKNGINKGVVITKKAHGLTLLYSFATKADGQEFVLQIQEQQDAFYKMGDHCFGQIQSIIEDNIIGYNSEKNNKKENKSNIIRITKHKDE